ncbi:MAG TPA: tyrosine-type recombinase/integrase [Xanthobacteraceae bacterium]|jgi:site-specific recombinase XerD
MTDQLPAIIEPTAPAAPTTPVRTYIVPALITDAGGDQTGWCYVEFFAANINNDHTRRAYARASSRFFAWCEQRGLTLTAIRPFDVAAWVKELQQQHGAPGVKQQLAAVRMLFDWLVTGQVVSMNPAAAVRGPKHIVKTGKTPVLESAEWRKLLDSIPTITLRDLRDRALIATLTYSFARITAALKMKVEDLRPRGPGWTIRLHEKGGKEHVMPCHHALAEALHAYIAAAGIAEDRTGWLFRSAPRHNANALTDRTMNQYAAWVMIRRRAAAAGITASIGNHTFRATGITAYLANGGALEHAQEMAAHESPRTTKLYDRTRERLTQDEVERIRL